MFDARAVAELPDVLLRPDAYPRARRPRLLATGYGGSVHASFSGSTAFLAEAGIAAGELDGAFTLLSGRPDPLLRLRGALWKARQLARRESPSGFKYSEGFNAHLWHRHLDALSGADVINNYQLYSPRFFRDRQARDIGAYYLDGTLHDYLRGYRDFDVARIDPRTTDRAVAVEAEGYHAADRVMVMSTAAQRTVVERYGLPPDRVEVVPPGANVTDAMAADVLAARRTRTHPDVFTIGFVGLYPERKGLPTLARAVAVLRSQRVPVRLQVVGNCPPEIAAADGVDALGVISKTREPRRFAAALARVDLGVQLSRAELVGIAVLEYLRCGIPALATEVGGVVDFLHQGGGIGLPAGAEVEQVAEAIRSFVLSEQVRSRLVGEARGRSDSVRWVHTATSLAGALRPRS